MIDRKQAQIQKELDMLAIEAQTVEQTREALDAFVDFMRGLEFELEEYIPFMGQIRGFSPEVINKLRGFMVNPEHTFQIPAKFRDYAYGIFATQAHNLFEGRFVFPVMDVYGHTAGFVGWDKDGHPKYLDSINVGYKSKFGGFFGMQFLSEYYKQNKIVVCEGPMCMIYLVDNGVPTVSSLGSKLTPYMITILKRFGENCLVIPDGHNDAAGGTYRKQVERSLPMARCVQPVKAKDIDDTRLWLRGQGEENADKIIANEVLKLLEDHFYESEYFM